MAFDKSKGMIAVATSYSGGKYNYEKLDKYIEASSLNITPDIVQEEESYRNANGLLKRPGIMPYTESKIEANIKHTDENTMNKVMSILKRTTNDKDAVSADTKITIRIYHRKKMEYSHAWAYFPDITYNVYGTYKGYPIYTATRIAFITYGERR